MYCDGVRCSGADRWFWHVLAELCLTQYYPSEPGPPKVGSPGFEPEEYTAAELKRLDRDLFKPVPKM